MTPPDLGNLLNKVKAATKQTADFAATKAKIGKLKLNLISLQTDKNRCLKMIGTRTYALNGETGAIDGVVLKERIREELSQIDNIETKIQETESEIAKLEASAPQVNIKDISDSGDSG
jgi:seryl-tRNA synthetase